MSDSVRKLIAIGLVVLGLFWSKLPGIDIAWPWPAPFNPPPIEGDSLMALVVYESSDPLPAPQSSALNGTEWRKYVDDHRGKWRVLDDDAVIDKEEAWVKQAMAHERSGVPWLLVSNGKGGASLPLPANEADLIAELKKWGE